MMDKAWIHLVRTSKEYKDGARKFVNDDVLRKNSDFISCPCRDCQNLFHRKSSIVYEHLVINGMDKSYTTWVLHGEEINSEKPRNEFSETYNLCSTIYEQDQYHVQDECDLESSRDKKNEEFIKMLSDVERPLYPGCKKHTRLSSTVVLYKVKVKYGISNNCFTKILEVVHDLLPEENTLPDSKYLAEKLIKDFQLEDKEIHACVNDCCLFRKDLENCETCPKCSFSRWKVDEQSKEIRH
ncbi:hypothetical protein ACHQM5_010110 [Ranunculus cassubicifolius]